MVDDQPAISLLTPSEVMALTGIPDYSLKRWARAHAAHLSPTAYPGPNQSGKFTQRDVEVLRAVKGMRERGLSVEIINERLLTTIVGEIEQPADNEGYLPESRVKVK